MEKRRIYRVPYVETVCLLLKLNVDYHVEMKLNPDTHTRQL